MKRIVDLENNRIVGDVVETREPDWNEIIKQYEKRAVIEYKEDVRDRFYKGAMISVFTLAILAIGKLYLMSGGFL